MTESVLSLIIKAQNDAQAALNQAQAQIKRLKEEAENTRHGFESLKSQISGFATVAAASLVAVGVAAAGIGIKAATEFIKFQDSMTGVAKTAGLTESEVKEMGAEILKIAPTTRSSIDELVTLAQIGGQFGVPKAELAGFTAEVNKINVALGDEFSGGAEEVAGRLTTLKNLFAETQGVGFGEAMKNIGSAINELGAAGTATGPVVSEFATRIGQLGPNLSPTITQTLGLGAAFQEMGLSAEISSGGLTNIMLTAGQKTVAFARQIGITEEAFKSLINSDPNEMLLQLAGSFQGLSNTEIAERMQELSLGSQESIKVMSLLANQTDMVRQKQELAAKAFAEGTSIGAEYDKVNNTTAANLAKLGNLIDATFIKIGQSFEAAFNNNPALQKLSEDLFKISQEVGKINFQPLADMLIGTLATAVTFVTSNFGLLMSILTGLSTGGVIVGITAGITAFSTAITAAGGIATVFGTIMSTVFWPIILPIAAITAAVAGLYLAWQTNFGGIQQIATTVFQTVLLPAFQQLQAAFAQLLPALQALWNAVGPMLMPVLQALGMLLAGSLVAAILGAVAAIRTLVEIFTIMANGATQAINSVKASFEPTINSIIQQLNQWGITSDTVQKAIAVAFVAIQASLQFVGAAFTAGFTLITGTLNAFISFATTFVSGIIMQFQGIITFFQGVFTGDMSKAMEGVKMIIDGFRTQWVQSGMNLVKGLIQGVQSASGEFFSTLKNMASQALESVRSVFKEHSPSRAMYESGSNFVYGARNAVLDKTGEFIKATTQMAQKGLEGAKSVLTGAALVESQMIQVSPTIQPGLPTSPVLPAAPVMPPAPITPPMAQAQPDPTAMTQPIQDAVGSVSGSVDQLITKLETGIADGITNGTDSIMEAMSGMEEAFVQISAKINENFGKIFTGMGGNIPKFIVNGIVKDQGLAFGAVADLSDTVLASIGAEIEGRKDNVRGLAKGFSMNSPQFSLFSDFKAAAGGGKSEDNSDNSKFKNANFTINNNGGFDQFMQAAGAL